MVDTSTSSTAFTTNERQLFVLSPRERKVSYANERTIAEFRYGGIFEQDETVSPARSTVHDLFPAGCVEGASEPQSIADALLQDASRWHSPFPQAMLDLLVDGRFPLHVSWFRKEGMPTRASSGALGRHLFSPVLGILKRQWSRQFFELDAISYQDRSVVCFDQISRGAYTTRHGSQVDIKNGTVVSNAGALEITGAATVYHIKIFGDNDTTNPYESRYCSISPMICPPQSNSSRAGYDTNANGGMIIPTNGDILVRAQDRSGWMAVPKISSEWSHVSQGGAALLYPNMPYWVTAAGSAPVNALVIGFKAFC